MGVGDMQFKGMHLHTSATTTNSLITHLLRVLVTHTISLNGDLGKAHPVAPQQRVAVVRELSLPHPARADGEQVTLANCPHTIRHAAGSDVKGFQDRLPSWGRRAGLGLYGNAAWGFLSRRNKCLPPSESLLCTHF